MLYGHTDLVNAVKFYTRPDSHASLILSGSVDRSVRIWRLADEHTKAVKVLEGFHQSSVNCLAALPIQSVFASGAADATICIWSLDAHGNDVQSALLQTIRPPTSFFPLSMVLHQISACGDALLAAGGTRSTVEVYLSKEKGSFQHQASLPGHEGWVRSLAITQESAAKDSDILLASASQDKYIRLWRLTKLAQASVDQSTSLIEKIGASLSNKKYILKGSECSFGLTFEALLLGHEDWVYSLQWKSTHGPLMLLSASADNSVAIWEPEANSGIWVCTSRFGEISLQKGSTTATGSTGGFWTSLWSPSGDSVISLARTGSWRIWTLDQRTASWTSGTGVSGHTRPVRSIAWSKDGSYLLSSSSDQTTRLHAEVATVQQRPWHEVGRPQIHGYDLNCIASINERQFISGADEKLLRVFDEPQSAAVLLRDICAIQSDNEGDLPASASLAVLGLSNKVDDGNNIIDTHVNDSLPILESRGANDMITSRREHLPTEDELARRTLWPEREKLYGHGYEISAVASSSDGKVVATSCRASSPEHAVVRLYLTSNWREVKPPLTAHSLTVTALAFAPDDRYLLSVGRDRQWTVFERCASEPDNYEPKYSNPKGHSRMILDACWAPGEFGRVFGTAGRDKTAKIWMIEDEHVNCVMSIAALAPVTTLNFTALKEQLLVAIADELGGLQVTALNTGKWSIISEASPRPE